MSKPVSLCRSCSHLCQALGRQGAAPWRTQLLVWRHQREFRAWCDQTMWGTGSTGSWEVWDAAGTGMVFTSSLCPQTCLWASQVGLCVYKQGRQIDLGNSLLFRESFSAWAVHQLPHKLLYLLLLTTHFSHAFAVMKTGWSTTLWQFHLFLLFSHKPKQWAAVASSAAW